MIDQQIARGATAALGIGFIWITIMIGGFIAWIYSIIDALKSNFKKNNNLTWVIILIALGPLGLILYWFIGRKEKIQNEPKIIKDIKETIKVCEKCGKEMITRTKEKKQYWVCKTYPECKNVIPV